MVAALMNNLLLADWFEEITSGMMPDHRFALIVIVIGCATAVICTVAMYFFQTINSIHCRRIEADMKREMLDRGMSADEIAKVIEAASPPENGTQRWIASWARKSKSA